MSVPQEIEDSREHPEEDMRLIERRYEINNHSNEITEQEDLEHRQEVTTSQEKHILDASEKGEPPIFEKMEITENLKKPAVCDQKDLTTVLEHAFDKHLLYPQPMEKKGKQRQKEKIPSAISSDAWRKYHENKLKEKENKENAVKKRKLERERSKTKTVKRCALENARDNLVVAKKQTCAICVEVLDSDTEEENEKNVGCDRCTRWFHGGAQNF